MILANALLDFIDEMPVLLDERFDFNIFYKNNQPKVDTFD